MIFLSCPSQTPYDYLDFILFNLFCLLILNISFFGVVLIYFCRHLGEEESWKYIWNIMTV